MELKKGLSSQSSVTVSAGNTAAAMGSGDLDVFATPAMVALMENAAMKAVADALEVMSEGERDTFVGTCDRVYSASVQVADAALKMAAAMQNVVTQLSMYEGQSATITPLESLARNDNDDEPDNEEE